MESEFHTLASQTIDSLRKAQKSIGDARTYIGIAISKRALSGNEQKLLQKARIDLSESYEKIRIVLEALKIAVK